jgi:anti-sigma B factor antagonist
MSDVLSIEVRSERGHAIAQVAGEIDIFTVARLRERLFDLVASSRHVVIDLDQVSFIDSAGLSALVGAANHAAAQGGGVRVVCARPKILKLFRLTGLDRRLPPAPTLDEALAAPGLKPR